LFRSGGPGGRLDAADPGDKLPAFPPAGLPDGGNDVRKVDAVWLVEEDKVIGLGEVVDGYDPGQGFDCGADCVRAAASGEATPLHQALDG